MVQSADLREGDHPSEFSPLNAPRLRSVLVERQMRARTVVVAGIRGKDPRSLTLRVLLADRRMRITADPERLFRVEGVFELPPNEELVCKPGVSHPG